jgi:outer membrane cobalamin receptor
VVIFLLFSFSLFSFSFSGKITDEGTKKNLSNVKLELVGTTKVVFSNQSGEYFFTGVKPGNYQILLYSQGYIPITKNIEIASDTAKDFSMKRDPLLLYELTVTATKTNHSLGDVPVAAEVITKQEIQDKGIKETKDIFDSFGGITVSKTSGSWGNKANISIQGMDPKHTLILVNGQRYVGGHGAVDLASIPVEIIEKVEVVKGPSSALYGSDAIGGVINIITKTPFQRKPEINLNATFGSEKLRLYEAGASYHKEKFGASLTFSRRETDGVNVDTDQIRETNLAGDLSYKISPQLSFNINPRYEYSDLTKQERIQKRFSLNSDFEWKITQGTEVKLRSSYFDYQNYTLDKSSDWDDKIYEVDLFMNTLIWGKHLLTVGYQLQYETIDDNGKEYEANQTHNSIYCQDEATFGSVDLVLGARVDIHKLWGTEFNPKISTQLRLNKNFKLKASVGRAFRGPQLVKLYGAWNMGPYLVQPNPDLKPETSIGVQGGFEWKVFQNININGYYFYNDIKELIAYKYDRGTRPWILTWENVDKAMTSGIELHLKAAILPNLTTSACATFIHTEDKITHEKLLNRPSYKGYLGVNYLIPGADLNFNATAYFTGKRDIEVDSVRQSLAPYTTMDIALSKGLGFARVFLRVVNLFNMEEVADEYNIIGTRIMGGIKLSVK